jgi:Tol biopolymer transport system component
VKATEAKNGTIAFALYPTDWKSPQDVEIWTQDAKSHFLTQVIRGVDPSISPDGTKIVYIGGDGNLWSVNVDGTQATQFSSDAEDILKRFQDNLAGWELKAYLQRKHDGTLLKYYHPYSFPSWSSDGNRIVYGSMAAADVTGRPDENIWMRDLSANKSIQLTTNGSVDRGPVMSPDGKWVYFMSNRGGRWCIWRIAAPAAD